jgi:hypothetical protein
MAFPHRRERNQTPAEPGQRLRTSAIRTVAATNLDRSLSMGIKEEVGDPTA